MQPDVREYLAAERTLLAYLRTSIAMMGFGFVVARFSLFLQELQTLGIRSAHAAEHTPSSWVGSAIVLAGVLLNLLAVAEYRAMVRTLNAANQVDWRASRLAPASTLFMAVLGLALAVYLICHR